MFAGRWAVATGEWLQAVGTGADIGRALGLPDVAPGEGEPLALGNGREGTGGCQDTLALVVGGARGARLSMCLRMALITAGSVITAITRVGEPHRGHTLKSMSKTRRKRYIQLMGVWGVRAMYWHNRSSLRRWWG